MFLQNRQPYFMETLSSCLLFRFVSIELKCFENLLFQVFIQSLRCKQHHYECKKWKYWCGILINYNNYNAFALRVVLEGACARSKHILSVVRFRDGTEYVVVSTRLSQHKVPAEAPCCCPQRRCRSSRNVQKTSRW